MSGTLEDQLRQSQRRLNAVLNNTRMAVFMMDERQHCTYMNAAAEALTGYSLAETQGRTLPAGEAAGPLSNRARRAS